MTDLNKNKDTVPAAWLALLSANQQLRLQTILDTVTAEEAGGVSILPPAAQRFTALNALPPDQVKLVIVGQDPYHGPGQAHGLSFSVRPGVAVPPSLRNIFKEIEADTGQPSICAGDGYLLPWAEQGVLLLNTTLTVRAGEAGSHEKLGWLEITSAWLAAVARLNPHIVFLLWGSHAQKMAAFLPENAHLLFSVHPSPLSAYRGFFGCRHFSQANRTIEKHGMLPIRW